MEDTDFTKKKILHNNENWFRITNHKILPILKVPKVVLRVF